MGLHAGTAWLANQPSFPPLLSTMHAHILTHAWSGTVVRKWHRSGLVRRWASHVQMSGRLARQAAAVVPSAIPNQQARRLSASTCASNSSCPSLAGHENSGVAGMGTRPRATSSRRFSPSFVKFDSLPRSTTLPLSLTHIIHLIFLPVSENHCLAKFLDQVLHPCSCWRPGLRFARHTVQLLSSTPYDCTKFHKSAAARSTVSCQKGMLRRQSI